MATREKASKKKAPAKRVPMVTTLWVTRDATESNYAVWSDKPRWVVERSYPCGLANCSTCAAGGQKRTEVSGAWKHRKSCIISYCDDLAKRIPGVCKIKAGGSKAILKVTIKLSATTAS